MSSSDDKYSLNRISELTSHFSSICSVCSLKLAKNNPGVPCSSCNSKIHSKCSGINDCKNTFHLYKGRWQCKNCVKDKFPFSELDNNSLLELAENSLENTKKFSEYSVDDKMKLLLSQSYSSNWYAHITTDDWDQDQTGVNTKFAYYDIADFKKSRQMWDHRNSLSLFHTNISSLLGNSDKLLELLTDLSWNFDIIALSETRNDEKNKANFSPTKIPGYHPYTGMTGSSQNGGCGFYIKSNITLIPRVDLEFKITTTDAQTESHWVEIISEKGPNTLVGVIYRHPSSRHDDFVQNLVSKLKIVKKENKKTILCGDFNINLLNFDKDQNVNKFLCTLLEFGFQPCITEPTRITNTNKPSLVDNIFTNTFDDPYAGNILEQISYDHLPNFVILNHVNKKKERDQMKRDKKNFNADKFNADLMDNDFLLKLLNGSNTDDSSNIFLTKFRSVLDKHAPMRKLSKREVKLKHNPWLTTGLLKSIQKKRTLFLKLKKLKIANKNADDVHKKYKSYNDLINKLKKKCKKDYYQNYFNENCRNSKKVWTGINKLLNRSKKKQGTIFLEENGIISDPLKVANKFNDFYLNIADKLCEKMPQSNNKYQDYLKNPNKTKFTIRETTPDEIWKVIHNLDGKKSGDIYDISPDIVKLSANSTSQALSIVFNLSVQEGCFPSFMKIAKILPQHKGDSVLSEGNYRPISLLPIFSKIFERLIYNRLIEFVDSHNILSELQFGFQKNKSTEQAVSAIVSALNTAKSNKMSSYCVFLDFAKAFDTVNHAILLGKLKHYGLKGASYSLLESYLTNRKQQVEINGTLSEYGIIKHGVPQGSVLGPLLFLLYINDISESSKVLKFFLFADDTTVYYADKYNKNTEQLLNTELAKVSDWLSANKLSLNVKKSNFLHFQYGRTKKTTINLKLNGVSVDEKRVTKYLGTFIDNKLTVIGNLISSTSKQKCPKVTA